MRARLTLLAADGLGRLGTVLAMLLMAVSPMNVFYSRYFIMEVIGICALLGLALSFIR